jgi:hypothetical protein
LRGAVTRPGFLMQTQAHDFTKHLILQAKMSVWSGCG